ncbi:hypothetical protein CLAFUW4_06927 [Fulvia fulva]|uniref:Uncharacterized protein n=1 Tax=Passalora fulva TaxID=5499 RepID=A0A9Q8LJG7_PASFU|nr:uncharacterized protein CLAFUR5_07064 [Fulvia fulva]KAK4621459.1 hypothetical protein CLAFUR4_06936 [Fulvia fulva]KAK4622432.1 hypothetical protein CLAFUR0_06934 [Fulvia fulva]UJO18528.1 hypothetical protein CLAFUR5_07064 [Fulvia fulva]WPV16281.1 hypothetical protein CLAFUW4_06927 [Fulvia fulva]WPV30874.1 hypothetical protein CLAFUW7_06927 [Fulvia fulva]
MTYDDSNEEGTTNNQYIPIKPQIQCRKPWPRRAKGIWELLCIVLPVMMIAEVFVPGGGGAFVATHILFCIIGGTGLLFFIFADPTTGIPKKLHLRRLPDDGGDGSSLVEVVRMRPLLGWKRCEMIGGREPPKRAGIADCDGAYVVYRWRSWVGRIRWERALFVVGDGEAEDCTAAVMTRNGVPVTRLQWHRGE